MTLSTVYHIPTFAKSGGSTRRSAMTNFQKPDPRRFMLRAWALCEARRIVKARLKAQGLRPTHYASAEISKLAEGYFNEGHWRELEAQAYEKIMGSPRLRAEYEAEGEKYERQLARRKTKAA
jgi:hypothetical protein